MTKKPSIQKTLFGDDIIVEYYGLNVFGETIKIPNFQPYDDNPRLDEENEDGKRKNKEREKNGG